LVIQWKKTAKQGSKTSLRHYQIECCNSGSLNIFARGPQKLLHNSSRAGHPV